MQRKNSLLIFLIIVLSFVLILNIFSLIKTRDIIEIREIDASIIVSDRIGFDLNSSALTFGAVSIGGSSSRQISFDNNYEFPVEIFIYGKGEMKEFIIHARENFAISEKKNIGISAKVPDGVGMGEYRGKVILKIKRAD